MVPRSGNKDLHMMALGLEHMIPLIFGHWSILLEVGFTATNN